MSFECLIDLCRKNETERQAGRYAARITHDYGCTEGSSVLPFLWERASAREDQARKSFPSCYWSERLSEGIDFSLIQTAVSSSFPTMSSNAESRTACVSSSVSWRFRRVLIHIWIARLPGSVVKSFHRLSGHFMNRESVSSIEGIQAHVSSIGVEGKSVLGTGMTVHE